MPIYATARLIRDLRASAGFSEKKRAQWVERLASLGLNNAGDAGAQVRARLERRVRQGAGGWMLRAVIAFEDAIASEDHAQFLRLKWCPDADRAALDATAQNMRWWSAVHPELAGGAADLVDYWPDEQVLLIAECPGRPLGAIESDAESGAAQLGAWFRRYALGHERYGNDVDPRLGATVRRDEAGRLWVKAQPLIEARLERAERAVDCMRRLEVRIPAKVWDTRDGEQVLAAHRDEQPAGFVHGDLKCGNVLVAADRVTVVDWWAAPCVSWPLTDIAHFAGSVWLEQSWLRPAIWGRFIDAYAPDGVDEASRATIALLARVSVLDYLAGRLRSSSARFLERGRVGRVLRDLNDPTRGIARFLARSTALRSVEGSRSDLPVAAGVDE